MRLHQFLLPAVVALAFVGCERMRPVAAQEPASAQAGAADDSSAALLDAAIRSWGGRVFRAQESGHDHVLVGEAVGVMSLGHRLRALVFKGEPANANGTDMGCNTCMGYVGVQRFALDGNRWQLIGPRQAVYWTGSNGDAGSVTLVQLGEGAQGIAIESSALGQGQTESWLSLHEVGRDSVRTRLGQLWIHSDQIGAYGSCQERVEVLNAADEVLQEPEDETLPMGCRDVHAEWQLKAKPEGRHELHIRFRVTTSEKTDETPPYRLRESEELVILRDAGKGYDLVSGKSPLPRY
jgi:hypothetical protein